MEPGPVWQDTVSVRENSGNGFVDVMVADETKMKSNDSPSPSYLFTSSANSSPGRPSVITADPMQSLKPPESEETPQQRNGHIASSSPSLVESGVQSSEVSSRNSPKDSQGESLANLITVDTSHSSVIHQHNLTHLQPVPNMYSILDPNNGSTYPSSVVQISAGSTYDNAPNMTFYNGPDSTAFYSYPGSGNAYLQYNNGGTTPLLPTAYGNASHSSAWSSNGSNEGALNLNVAVRYGFPPTPPMSSPAGSIMMQRQAEQFHAGNPYGWYDPNLVQQSSIAQQARNFTSIPGADVIQLGSACQESLPSVAELTSPITGFHIPSSTVITKSKECVACGAVINNSWRKDDSGHVLCDSCSTYHPTQMASGYSQQDNSGALMPQPLPTSVASGPTTTGHHHKSGSNSSNSHHKPKRSNPNGRRQGLVCSNCKTVNTTLWRRNAEGEPVCNACGLYYKLHSIARPLTMKKEVIQSRKRKPRTSSGKSSKSSRASSNNNANETRTITANPYASTQQSIHVGSVSHHQQQLTSDCYQSQADIHHQQQHHLSMQTSGENPGVLTSLDSFGNLTQTSLPNILGSVTLTPPEISPQGTTAQHHSHHHQFYYPQQQSYEVLTTHHPSANAHLLSIPSQFDPIHLTTKSPQNDLRSTPDSVYPGEKGVRVLDGQNSASLRTSSVICALPQEPSTTVSSMVLDESGMNDAS